jgi:hypothetical protein
MRNTVFPTMFTIEQEFESHALPYPAQELRRQLSMNKVVSAMKPEAQVAIAIGSRGITDIVALAATLVDELKQRGADPFIVPAIGSQGGATPDGQAAVLRSLGITKENVGAPIRSVKNVVRVGETKEGLPVYCDELAYRSDLVVLINRIKEHTAFRGNIESGLMKMMAVALGKRESAQVVHSSFLGLAEAILQSARILMQNAPVGLGIAIVEDSYGRTSKIAVLEPSEIEETEKKLLKVARQMMPRLPFDELDVLIVEEMGKNISGAGMDPNIIGMGRRLAEHGRWKPEIDRVVVLDLTEESRGNAEGIGLADVVTQRLVDKADFKTTYINCITSGFFRGGMIPITMNTDREAIEVAVKGYVADQVRLVRIKNTLKLDEMDVSESFLGEIRSKRNLQVVGERGPLAFTKAGDLL